MKMNIVFEGVDASGKTTIIKQVLKRLLMNGVECKTISDMKEQTPLLPVIEKMFNTNFLEVDENFKTSLYQTLLFSTNHFYVQEKNKNNTGITIYDRDIFTILAYQKEFLKEDYPQNYNEFFDSFRKMMMFEQKDIDMIVYVSVPLDLNIERKKNRDGLIFSEREKKQIKNFKNNMEEEIDLFSKQNPNTVVLKLDGREDVSKNCKTVLNEIAKLNSRKNTSHKKDKNNDQVFQ